MRKMQGKDLLVALLVMGLLVTAFFALGSNTGQGTVAKSMISKTTFQLPAAVRMNSETLLAWDCPGCPGN